MAVEVKVPTILRQATGGEPVVRGDGRTLREVLDDLERRYPGFARRVLSEDGGLHRFVNVYVNGRDVRYEQELATPVSDTDTVIILPAMAGGE